MIKLFEEYKNLPDIPSNIMYGSDIDINNFELNKDGTFNYNGNLNLQGFKLKELPDFKINTVEGSFKCNSNKLTSLKNSPEIIKGDFWCNYNKLLSFMGLPKVIGGNLQCNSNLLLSSKHDSTIEGTDNSTKVTVIEKVTDEVLAVIKEMQEDQIGLQLEFFRQRDKKAYDLMKEALNELNIDYLNPEDVDDSGMF